MRTIVFIKDFFRSVLIWRYRVARQSSATVAAAAVVVSRPVR